jgi:hypothetical protein
MLIRAFVGNPALGTITLRTKAMLMHPAPWICREAQIVMHGVYCIQCRATPQVRMVGGDIQQNECLKYEPEKFVSMNIPLF